MIINIFFITFEDIHFTLHITPLIFNSNKTITHSTIIIKRFIIRLIIFYLYIIKFNIVNWWIFEDIFILFLEWLSWFFYKPDIICYLLEGSTLLKRRWLWLMLDFYWFFRRRYVLNWFIFYVIIFLDVRIEAIFYFILWATW